MKWKLFIIVCLLIITLSGCKTSETLNSQNVLDSQSQLYEIDFEDGIQYLRFSEQVIDLWGNSASSQIKSTYPHFVSAEDMRQRIKSKQIPLEEMASIFYSKNNANKVKIINLDNISDLKYPNDLQVEKIIWYGDFYTFQLSTGNCKGYIDVLEDSTYEEIFYKKYTHFINDNQTIISEEQVAERDANVIVYTNHTGTYKSVSYQLQSGSKTIFVRETYTLDYNLEIDSVLISDNIPTSIDILGEDSVCSFYGWFSGFESRPTTDWLLSFGLTELDS